VDSATAFIRMFSPMPSSIPSYAGANYETNQDKSLLTVELQKTKKKINIVGALIYRQVG